MGKRNRRLKRWLKKQQQQDDGSFLPDSYFPLGHPVAVECEDDGQLEDGYLKPHGLYTDVEIGEGPTGWF